MDYIIKCEYVDIDGKEREFIVVCKSRLEWLKQLERLQTMLDRQKEEGEILFYELKYVATKH